MYGAAGSRRPRARLSPTDSVANATSAAASAPSKRSLATSGSHTTSSGVAMQWIRHSDEPTTPRRSSVRDMFDGLSPDMTMISLDATDVRHTRTSRSPASRAPMMLRATGPISSSASGPVT